MQRTILSITLLAMAHGLPQIQQTEKDLVDVENFLEQQLPAAKALVHGGLDLLSGF